MRVTSVRDDLVEESASIEDILDGTELVLGPALDVFTFPDGPPRESLARVRALMGISDPTLADEIAQLAFPEGVPDDVDATCVLRALRQAAVRARAGLDSFGEPIDQSGRRLAILWAIAAERHAVAARSVHGLAGVLLDAMASQWVSMADSLEHRASA